MKLIDQDRFWITRRIPKEVWNLMRVNKNKLFLAGGFIRACIANETPNDIDLFAQSKEHAREMANHLTMNGHGLKMVETDNAFTVLGLFVPVQFIHRWTFATPEECVKSFDFTIARAAVWIGDEQDSQDHAILSTFCEESFYPDLAAKRLVYCQPIRNEDAGGSMLRVLKFYQRGYRIPLNSLAAVISRMVVAVDMNQIDAVVASVGSITREQQIAHVMTGMLHEVDPNLDPHTLDRLPCLAGPK